MAEIIKINIGKIKKIREIKSRQQELQDELLSLAREITQLTTDRESLIISIALGDVYRIANKRVCGNCLTDQELLSVLQKKADSPKKTWNPKTIKCTRCKKECG